MPLFARNWLEHNNKDAYWKRGSINEDYSAIEAAVYCVGGCGLFKLNTKLVDSNIIARINNEINDPEYILRAYDT